MPGRGGTLPGYRGHIDAVEPLLAGWLVDAARPDEPVAFAVAVDGARVILADADRPRPDVFAAGLGGPNCGFAVELPSRVLDGAEHELTLLLPDGSNLHLPGAPLRIALGPVHAEIVPAATARPDAVFDLLRRNDAESGFDPLLVSRENAALFNAIRRPEQGFLFYARVGGRLVGYARLDRGRNAAADIGVVGLTVLEAFRRKGLGEAPLRALLDAAANGCLRQVWLSVRRDNTPAIHLYEKLGFSYDPNPPPGRWVVPGETTMVWLPE
jgi:ribosomal protein S18 acetylase RimI-like enzyme